MTRLTDPLKKPLNWLVARHKTSRTPVLGERELAVMHALWHAQSQADNADAAVLSAQQVLERMTSQSLALSTIQSTLERLCRKSLVARQKQARAYLYRPLLNRQDLISSMLHDISQDIAGGDVAPMLSGFMDYLSASRDD